ncbi:Uma2 family endonuclease [Kyrpidia spormannii]|uniref:Uma2 family endonuclease n=1 Tax=Kyrpidia spormannii TaxID=2055160 RepID=A0A6F9EH82_9BACL|nr:Uma2 family endonuclease [Kyrpidia spormannii]CAB3396221.1 Uma2 family endonuclease [Kyrpidia spormannii]
MQQAHDSRQPVLPERYEVIDGRVYDMSPPPSEIHQRIVTNLLREFSIYLKGRECFAYPTPFGVWWKEDDDEHVEPDITVICDPGKIRPQGCVGAPDLIVEVLGKSTAEKDRGVKMTKYRIAGVREYWIVDPEHETVEVYHWEDNVFQQPDVYGGDGEIPVRIFDDLVIKLRDVF